MIYTIKGKINIIHSRIYNIGFEELALELKNIEIVLLLYAKVMSMKHVIELKMPCRNL